MIRIGELARAAGVSVDTLRFYERRGLLAPAARSEGGYRFYDKAALARLAFIQRAKALGFTLAEISGVLGVMEGGQPPCAHVRALLEEKLADLERQMELLAEMRRDLFERLAWARAHPDPACDGRDSCVYLEPLPQP